MRPPPQSLPNTQSVVRSGQFGVTCASSFARKAPRRHRLLLVVEVLLGALLLTLPTSAAPTQARGEDPAELLRQAAREQADGRFDLAVKNYQLFLSRYPGYADVHSNLGAALVSLGRLSEAINHYQKALQLGNSSDPSRVRLNLGLAFYKAADFSQAKEQFKQVLAVQPANLSAAMLLADIHLRRGEWKDVIQILQPFEQVSANERGLLYLLGTALIRDGQVKRGEALIDVILREGESAEAHLLMGMAHLMVLDHTGAQQEFEKAVQLNPKLPSLHAVYGRTLREMGLEDEAVRHFRLELEINPYDFDSLLFTGVYLYRRQQDYPGALQHFEKALAVRPGSLAARFQIGLVYLLTDRVPDALSMVEGVVAEAPDFLEGHVTLTRLYYRLSRRDDASRHRQIVEELRKQQDARSVKSQEAAEGLQRELAGAEGVEEFPD